MTLHARSLSPALGVQITGLDTSGMLGEADKIELRELLDEHQLLLFRGQDLSAEAQIRFVSTFGPVLDEYSTGNYYSLVSNVEGSAVRPGMLLFHQDLAFTPAPYPILSLYALDIHGKPAGTRFASNVAASASLDEEELVRLAKLSAVNVQDWTPEGQASSDTKRTRLLELPPDTPPSGYPRATHPVIKRHPRTGIRLLFVTEFFTSHIEGVTDTEGEAVLQQCFERLYAPENLYEHDWGTGDLIVWDNLAVQHARNPAVPESRRTLRRVLVSERSADDLFAAAGSEWGKSGTFVRY